MTVLPLLCGARSGDSRAMDIQTIPALAAIFALLTVPSLIWYLKELSIDRALRAAETPDLPKRPVPAVARTPRVPSPRLPHRPRTTAGQAH